MFDTRDLAFQGEGAADIGPPLRKAKSVTFVTAPDPTSKILSRLSRERRGPSRRLGR
jgi:hypothetical protein